MLKKSRLFLYCIRKYLFNMIRKKYIATFLVNNPNTGKTTRIEETIEAPNLLFARDEAKMICNAIDNYALESVRPM